jgi:hypothetical protein
MGVLTNNSFWGQPVNLTADAAVFHLGSVAAETQIYNNPQGYRSVVGQAGPYLSSDPAVPYSWVCFIGQTTISESCGYISNTGTTTNVGSMGYDGIAHQLTNQIVVYWNAGDAGVLHGDSGGPLYGLNPDGSAIALGILSQCDQPSGIVLCTSGGASYFSKIAGALTSTATTLKVTGRHPFGTVDVVQHQGGGNVLISGWIIDPDLARTPTSVHVYFGGPAGGGGTGYVLQANLSRPDVAAAYPNTGSSHGFSQTIYTGHRGAVPIYLYGIDIGDAYVGHPLLWSGTIQVN